jgi:hypothetical protein
MSRRELLFGKKSPANEFRSGGFPAAKHLKPKPTSIRKAGTLSFGSCHVSSATGKPPLLCVVTET